jgi:hypothetical protein
MRGIRRATRKRPLKLQPAPPHATPMRGVKATAGPTWMRMVPGTPSPTPTEQPPSFGSRRLRPIQTRSPKTPVQPTRTGSIPMAMAPLSIRGERIFGHQVTRGVGCRIAVGNGITTRCLAGPGRLIIYGYGGGIGINIGRHPHHYHPLRLPPVSPVHPILRVHNLNPRPPVPRKWNPAPVKLATLTAMPMQPVLTPVLPTSGWMGGSLYRDYPVQGETHKPVLGTIAAPVAERTPVTGWIAPPVNAEAPRVVRTPSPNVLVRPVVSNRVPASERSPQPRPASPAPAPRPSAPAAAPRPAPAPSAPAPSAPSKPK